MSLKQDIMVRSEYTIRKPGGGGSRGGTPGQYIMRYMSRDQATQTLAPVRRTEIDTYVMRYMAREDAVQQLSVDQPGSEVTPGRRGGGRGKNSERTRTEAELRWRARANGSQELRRVEEPDGQSAETPETGNAAALQRAINRHHVKDRFRDAQKLGGRAFGYGSVSMSDAELRAASADIQAQFDQGKTVLKTVLSFSQDYLVKHGIIRPDLTVNRPGDYRGEIDELKMRSAIMHGLDRMGRSYYDDLRYVGVIQVDTEHVHAHLAMVDKGVGTVMSDGTQRGKISPKAITALRRGVDSHLDEHAHIAHLSAHVGAERQNVAGFVKRWAVQTLVRESAAQYVVANLPENENQWRAGSNSRAMARANTLVRDLVEERLSEPDSPMRQAMREISAYADTRQRKEGLSGPERQALVARGRERMVTQSMNGVYSVLAAIPRQQRAEMSTRMMDVMTMDIDQLRGRVADGAGVGPGGGRAGVNPLEQMGLRARTWASRRRHHRSQRDEYQSAARDWEKARADGVASDESRVMYEHYQVEAQYHGRAAQKYEQALGTVVGEEDWRGRWERIAEYGDRYLALRAMRQDRSLPKMRDAQAAEELGRRLYGHGGAGTLTRTGAQGRAARAHLDSRIDAMGRHYGGMVDEANARLATRGAHLRLRAQAGGERAPGRADPLAQKALPLRRSSVRRTTGAVELYDPQAAAARMSVHTPGAPVELVRAPAYDPREVRGVDMHDMRGEILVDQPVGRRTARAFSDLTAARRRALEKARDYLLDTTQTASPLAGAERDIVRAERTVAEVNRTGTLSSEIGQRVAAYRRRREQARQAREAETAAAVAPAPVISVPEGGAPGAPETGMATEADTVSSGRSFRVDQRVRRQVNHAVDAQVTRETQRVRDEGLGG